MSVSVGAALKKLAVTAAADKELRRRLLGAVLVVIVLVVMPVAAVLAVFNGDVELDTDRLTEIVKDNLSDEESAKLRELEGTMNTIQQAMTNAGQGSRAKEAQVLYVLALYDRAGNEGFVDRLTACFWADQSDAQLIAAVNAAFGKELSAEDFSKVMRSIRTTTLSTDGYVNPYGKNNLDLVRYAMDAKEAGWGYVWGTFGRVLTGGLYESLVSMYGNHITDYEDFIKANWMGKRTADCVGLIKGYGWLNPDTMQIEYGSNGMVDLGADQMYQHAVEKGPIDTIPEVPGLAVWHTGHIGVYIGDGQVIEAMGTRFGVVQTSLSGSTWTHWLRIPFITYMTEEAEPEETDEAHLG